MLSRSNWSLLSCKLDFDIGFYDGILIRIWFVLVRYFGSDMGQRANYDSTFCAYFYHVEIEWVILTCDADFQALSSACF
jgi:hypothetical protein